MRSFNGKPDPTPPRTRSSRQGDPVHVRIAQLAHGLPPRRQKPKNIVPDWLPLKDWTPEADQEEEGEPA